MTAAAVAAARTSGPFIRKPRAFTWPAARSGQSVPGGGAEGRAPLVRRGRAPLPVGGVRVTRAPRDRGHGSRRDDAPAQYDSGSCPDRGPVLYTTISPASSSSARNHASPVVSPGRDNGTPVL